ncbi:unnamed protein product [Hermetia illucens]|uniref:Uncharacterized protein n=1 Tax=Hermetia illucens TaxID=343691 RepID=A0A7R8UW76_HERIL|nr:pupal cuticle protein Edg-84A-like [Hermetia illucens]CAD7087038.1 unnamed protein product [Hermetia illucens]
MLSKFALLALLIGLCQAIPILTEDVHHDDAHYEFAYSVHDDHTGDIKDQHESRKGDVVEGEYSLIEPDGQKRTVKYSSDHHGGFQAYVERGESKHPTGKALGVASIAVGHHVAPVAYAHHVAPVVTQHISPIAIAHPVTHIAPVAHVVPVAHVAPVAVKGHVATSISNIKQTHNSHGAYN